MDSMDLKGIAWVGHIYQKFEAMCLEIEEAMCQETAKYVENQVQTVGAGMKRFCSDVMQDMIPPSSKDLSKVASADLILNPYLEFEIHKKPISNIKENAINIKPVCVKGISEDKKSNSSNDDWVDWSAASFNWEINDKDEENCDILSMKALNKTPVTTVSTKSSVKVVNRSRCISSSNILRAERTDTCDRSQLVSQEVSQATSNKLSSQSSDGDGSHTGKFVNFWLPTIAHLPVCNFNMPQNFIGRLADCNPDLGKEAKNDVSIQSMEPFSHEFETNFEETCVLVDGNDCRPDDYNEEIRRSYKKKIQKAFSLKKKSARKQEYKQLAGQYSIANAESNNKCDEVISLACSQPKNIKANKLATHDSLESEWEIL
ncbi:hypothetical protein R6Q57_024243 [Mikania cordata]